MCNGKERAKNKMKEIELKGNGASKTDQDTYQVLELILEFYERGLNFLPVDLYKSDSKKFIVENDGVRPPFNTRIWNSISRKFSRSTKRRKIHVNKRPKNKSKNRRQSNRSTKNNRLSTRYESK